MKEIVFGTIASFLLLIRTHWILYRIGKRYEENPETGEPRMVWIYILAAIVAIFLFAYLVAALFYAEKF
jgi:K+-transporting ATPase KdpF subunit